MFGASGDIDFATGNNAVNFLAPGYATLPTLGSTNVALGGSYDFLLSGGVALTLNEQPNGATDSQETGARSFRVTLNLQYSFTSATGPSTSLAPETITISSPAGTGGQIPLVEGPVADSAANESDPWDVRFLFDGLYAS